MRTLLPTFVLAIGYAVGCKAPTSSAQVPPTELTLPKVPKAIAVPPGNHVILRLYAEGTQTYSCYLDGGSPVWSGGVPTATLYTDESKHHPVGTHSKGPTWVWSQDQSAFVGDKHYVASVTAPSGVAIPWLRIPKRSASSTGKLSSISYVQRVDTAGGIANPSLCIPSHG